MNEHPSENSDRIPQPIQPAYPTRTKLESRGDKQPTVRSCQVIEKWLILTRNGLLSQDPSHRILEPYLLIRLVDDNLHHKSPRPAQDFEMPAHTLTRSI